MVWALDDPANTPAGGALRVMPGDYLAGANITGFERVAEAMLALGVL